MKTVGIITEYNPFHNGHAYHIARGRELTGADYCIAVMSGNFVQRGEPAVIDKFTRAEMALAGGADLVIELPVFYAAASAEYFAAGAVALLDQLGVVDALCFGSEAGDLPRLSGIADILAEEPPVFRQRLKELLGQGRGFPEARQQALEECLSAAPDQNLPAADVRAILAEPNNILAIEYLKALKRLNSRIEPVTISRAGGGYHQIEQDQLFSSATHIRRVLAAPPLSAALAEQVPAAVYALLQSSYEKSCPVLSGDFSLLLHYRLLQFRTAAELTAFLDVSADLADRIWRCIPAYQNLEQFTRLIGSRQLTTGRIRRCLLHILLDITTAELNQLHQSGYHYYARVLGFRRNSTALLHQIKAAAAIPLITKLARADDCLDRTGRALLAKEITASQIYHAVTSAKFGQPPYNEYQRQLVII